ncbi:MAG: diaminopimelate epimerase [Planctomycetes bacterium]|nr:diaminopimelate epimerase [Planctomycetota bacterium]
MIEFTKMSGSGNDFIVINAHTQEIADPASLAQRLCPRRTAIGADGILLIAPAQQADFRMRIFNSDGSESEMCGNGARCAAVFANQAGLAGKEMVFETLAGLISATLTSGGARVQLTDSKLPRYLPTLAFAGQVRDAFFLNTGVPHAVVPIENLEAVPVVEWGRVIRNHPEFGAIGTNVNFITLAGEGAIAVRTYERGVEDETLACGTGATASALVAATLWKLSSPVKVRVHSGEILSISFCFEGEIAKKLFLEGPVKIIYKGRAQV